MPEVQDAAVKIYSKPGWGPCDIVKSFFDRNDVDYTTYSVVGKENREHLLTYRDLGFDKMPAVVAPELDPFAGVDAPNMLKVAQKYGSAE